MEEKKEVKVFHARKDATFEKANGHDAAPPYGKIENVNFYMHFIQEN